MMEIREPYSHQDPNTHAFTTSSPWLQGVRHLRHPDAA
jgi:hypothetical protein